MARRSWIVAAALASACGIQRAFVPFQSRAVGESERLERRLDELWYEALDRSPERATALGRRSGVVAFDPVTPEGRALAADWIASSLAALEADFDARSLSERDARLLERARRELERERAAWAGPRAGEPNAWSGAVTTAPTLLGRSQSARNAEDLRAWIERLRALAALAGDEAAIALAGDGAARLPRPLLEPLLELLSVLADGSPVAPLLDPFERAARRLPAPVADPLVRRARQVVRDEVRPAYARLVAALETQRARASEVCGAWSTPEAEASWRAELAAAAGPAREPLELHELGRNEIRRLHRELGALAPEGVELAAWFDRLREDPASAPGGRIELRAPAELWSLVQVELPRLVARAGADLPASGAAAPWEWPRGRWSPFVPAPREPQGAGLWIAPPPADPLRPRWMREFDALRYGIPGRALFDHLVARAPIPALLAHAPREAHAEGWSLWLAGLAFEEVEGLERDRGFARLSSELTEAALLVADTGMHGRRWTRAQTVDHLREVTPLPIAACEELVLRIAAEPGRAAAPFLGLVELRALERRAILTLGVKHDAAVFRRAVVDEGPLDPVELEALVQRWIEARAGG